MFPLFNIQTTIGTVQIFPEGWGTSASHLKEWLRWTTVAAQIRGKGIDALDLQPLAAPGQVKSTTNISWVCLLVAGVPFGTVGFALVRVLAFISGLALREKDVDSDLAKLDLVRCVSI